MIDHTGLQVSDPGKSRAFYNNALKPIGYEIITEIPKEYTNGAVVLDGHNIEVVCHERQK